MTITIDFPEAIVTAMPNPHAPQGSTSFDQVVDDTHECAVEGPLSDSQLSYNAQTPSAVGTLHPADAIHDANPNQGPHQQGSTSLDHVSDDAQKSHVEGPFSGSQLRSDHHGSPASGTLPPAATEHLRPMVGAPQGPLLFDGYLCLVSDSLDDIEGLRIATDNRIRSLTRTEVDVDGEYRGLGLDARSPEVARAMAMAESIQALEHQTTLDLQRVLRKHPLHGWVKRSKGIGEKQAARLLAVIGDPYWNDLHERPRTVSELWAYCGYSVNSGRAQRRTKGVLSNWNDKAKMRAFLMAQSCVKSGGPYREVYDQAREQYAEAVHPHDCVRCGPAGKPAREGTPISAGHQHARALRLVAKAILKDLWLEARLVHELHEGADA